MLKKINAALSFLTAVLALGHTTTMGLFLFGVLKLEPTPAVPGLLLLGCFTIHVILSLIIVFFNSGNGITYIKQNMQTVMQRVMAILLMVAIHFHSTNYVANGAFVPQSVFGLVTEVLFAYFVFSHFNISTEKGLITLGINKKPLIIICRVLSIAAFAYALVAIFTYFLGGLL